MSRPWTSTLVAQAKTDGDGNRSVTYRRRQNRFFTGGEVSALVPMSADGDKHSYLRHPPPGQVITRSAGRTSRRL